MVLAILTAASVTTIVALALLPTLMVFHCWKSPNWASSALGCGISWLVMLFVTIFIGLELGDQQASYFADGGSLDQLATVSGYAGVLLFAASLVFILIRRHLQSRQD